MSVWKFMANQSNANWKFYAKKYIKIKNFKKIGYWIFNDGSTKQIYKKWKWSIYMVGPNKISQITHNIFFKKKKILGEISIIYLFIFSKWEKSVLERSIFYMLYIFFFLIFNN